MNKVKLFLSAITVTTIVGSALAYKSSKLPLSSVYCSIDDICVKVNFTLTWTVQNSDNPCSGDYFYIHNTCPITTSFTTQDDPTTVPVQKVKRVIE